jgi:dsRNA-specific ribonuclease
VRKASIGALDFFKQLYCTNMSDKVPKKQQRKRATMTLNEHRQRGHTVFYKVFECPEHTCHLPKYGCKVYINNRVEGTSQDRRSKKAAKEAAARKAVESLILPSDS